MLKKILGSIRQQLLKVQWIKREVARYLWEKKKEENRRLWAQLMHTGGAIRDHKPDEPHKTLATVGDSGIVVEYMDGRMIGQRGVTPIFIDSTNWGVRKSEDPLLHVCSSDRNNVEPSISKDGANVNGKTNVNYARTIASIGPCEAEQA